LSLKEKRPEFQGESSKVFHGKTTKENEEVIE